MPTYSKLTCLEATTQWRSGCLLTQPSWRHMQRRWREKQHHAGRFSGAARASNLGGEQQHPDNLTIRSQPGGIHGGSCCRSNAAASASSSFAMSSKRRAIALDGRPWASSRASCARAPSAAMAAAGGSCDIPQKRPRSRTDPSRAVQASGVINSGLQAAVALCRWCRRDTNQNDSRRFDGNDGPLGGHISATNKNQGRNWLDFSPESTGLSKIAIGARRPGSRCREMAAGSAGRRTPRGAASCRGGPQTSG
jgi:hypothetical protein